MAGRIFVISGAPLAGKTTLLNLVASDSRLRAASARKWSTRPPRNLPDDVMHTDSIDDPEFTFVYAMNGEFYAIRADEILQLLGTGHNVFVVLSDLRTVREMKSFFGSMVTSIYVYRNISEKRFRNDLRTRDGAEFDASDRVNGSGLNRTQRIRVNRLYLMQRQYVDNLTLFDHVVLNTQGRPQDMREQIVNIVQNYENNRVRSSKPGPVLFLVAGSSGSGKHTLMSLMNDLGRRVIGVVRKATTREVHYPPEGDDGHEIYHVDDLDAQQFQVVYEFFDTKYGVDFDQIWMNLRSGKCQVLITNREQFHHFVDAFGDLAVPIYLHSTRTRQERRIDQVRRHGEAKAKRRLENVEYLHRDYIKNIADYRHVLLNTMEAEDLAEQMLRLIDYYRDPVTSASRAANPNA